MRIQYLSPSDTKCPVCGSTNIQSISRVTGYLSLDERFTDGKVKERAARVDHNNNHQKNYLGGTTKSLVNNNQFELTNIKGYKPLDIRFIK